MVFSSFTFLFLFLPAFLAVYYLSPNKIKNFTALVGSIAFYGWGAPAILPLLLLSCALDYYLSSYLANQRHDLHRRKTILIFALLHNVVFLGYYKYSNFFIAETNSILQILGMPSIPWQSVILPIGISFFTFQKISYLLDVYHNKTAKARNLSEHILYVVLFPQLIAGPIVRYHDVAEQIKQRTYSINNFAEGSLRFCIGLSKKILIADEMGKVANNVFNFQPGTPGTLYLWIGLIAYAYQIYFDFSAYSDMAIGLGRMLGFNFLENFDRPYIAKNITEFWRRWHISLSNWMREYLYLPLGGNRRSLWRNYLNLWLVFLFSGLWHGASWNFVLWGFYHGLFLTFDKLFWLKISSKLPVVISVIITFIVVLFSWVLFKTETLELAIDYYRGLFNLDPSAIIAQQVFPSQIIHLRGVVVFIIATILAFMPDYFKIAERMLIGKLWNYVIALLLFSLAVLNLASNDFSPFLYFKF